MPPILPGSWLYVCEWERESVKREAKEHRNPSAEKCRHLAVCFSSKSWVALSHLRALDLDQSSHSFPRCFSLCCRSARECEGSSLLSLSASQRHSFTHSHSHSLTVRDAGNRETANYDTITSPFSCRRQSPLSCSRPLALVRSLCSLSPSAASPSVPLLCCCRCCCVTRHVTCTHVHRETENVACGLLPQEPVSLSRSLAFSVPRFDCVVCFLRSTSVLSPSVSRSAGIVHRLPSSCCPSKERERERPACLEGRMRADRESIQRREQNIP